MAALYPRNSEFWTVRMLSSWQCEHKTEVGRSSSCGFPLAAYCSPSHSNHDSLATSGRRLLKPGSRQEWCSHTGAVQSRSRIFVADLSKHHIGQRLNQEMGASCNLAHHVEIIIDEIAPPRVGIRVEGSRGAAGGRDGAA